MATSNYQRDDDTRLSMREKSLVKRRINAEHNSNFRAGYVQIDEDHLHKAGIRGRKSYIFWALITSLVFAIITNAALTLWIVVSLDIGREGMETLEFTPNGALLRFLADTEVDEVVPYQNTLTSLSDGNLELSARDAHQVAARVAKNNKTTAAVSASRESITVESSHGFTVTHPETGHIMFSTDYDDFCFPENISNLLGAKMETRRVTGGLNEHLTLEGNSISLSGENAVSIDSSSMLLSAKTDLDITAFAEIPFPTHTSVFACRPQPVICHITRVYK